MPASRKHTKLYRLKVIKMFDSMKGFGDQLFTVIVLLVSVGVSSHMCFGFGSKKAKEVLIGLILMLIIGTQFYHLINAAIYVPATPFYTYDVRRLLLIRSYVRLVTISFCLFTLSKIKLHRTDCLESTKGTFHDSRNR